ncbi:MAG: FHA domain-containing protein [Archangium sp.]
MELEPTRTRVARSQSLGAERIYLLVYEADTSRVVRLAAEGELFIGRARECEVRLADDGASRKHARLELRAGEVSISDLSSHNGTRVNGVRITAGAPLAAGDVVTISDSTLVLHCGERQAPVHAVISARVFRERLTGELACAAHHERSLCVARLEFSGKPDAVVVERTLEAVLGMMDVACWFDDALVVLLPEVMRSDAPRAVKEILEALAEGTTAAAGFAVFPDDGTQPDTLLLAARQAASKAVPGGLESADQTGRRLLRGIANLRAK